MSRFWVGVVAFAVGVAVGLQVAKVYAQQTLTADVDAALNKFGLGGGAVQSFADSYVPTLVG